MIWEKVTGFIKNHPALIIFFTAAILLFAGLGASPIYILDEARNAQAAWEMMERHDWIVPTFNGELRGHKPPLHYYFMQAAYTVFGKTAFAARFFSAVMGLLTLALTYFFVKKFLNRGTALWTIAILLASTHFLFEFRLAVPDPYLIFFTTAGIFCFYAYVQFKSWSYLLLSAVAIALAVLAKGPVAVALPGAAIVVWLLYYKKWNLLFNWKNLVYIAVIALIAFPWFIKVHQLTNGQFTKEFFFTHNVGRFSEPMEGHGGLFILIPLFVIIGLLPVSVFIGEPLRKIKLYRRYSLILLSIAVTAVFILFFAISGTKLPNYPMPCYPFAALIIGFWINRMVTQGRKVKPYPFIVLIVLTSILFIAALAGIGFEPALAGKEWWAMAFILLPDIAIIAYAHYRRSGLAKSLRIMMQGYVVFNFLFLVILYNAVYRQNPVALSLSNVEKNQPVLSYKIYNPAFNFYLPGTIYVAENANELKKKIREYKNPVIITRESLVAELDSLHLQVISRHRDLFETPTTVILTQPAMASKTH